MQRYQFDKIYTQMEKEFGKIRSGEEEDHAMVLFPMESNAVKIRRKYPTSNSRRFREAIALALFDVKARYTGEAIDLDKFRDEDNARLEKALLMAFEPFTNEEIRTALKEHSETEPDDPDSLRDYYAEPIRCMLRIKESVDIWEKQLGADGYFTFLENTIGMGVEGEEMKFSVLM